MKLKINNKKKTEKLTNMWKVNNTFLKNQEVKEEIKKEIKNILKTNEKRNTVYQNLGGAEIAQHLA